MLTWVVTIVLALVVFLAPGRVFAVVDGCFLKENNIDFLLLEDNASFFLLEGDDGGACGGVGGPSVFPINKRQKIDAMMMEPQ